MKKIALILEELHLPMAKILIQCVLGKEFLLQMTQQRQENDL